MDVNVIYNNAVISGTRNEINLDNKHVEKQDISNKETAAVLELSIEGVNISSTASAQNYQQMLSNLGFFSGAFDGNLSSSASIKAIGNFQRVYGLKITNKIDKETADKLSLSNSEYHDVLIKLSELRGKDKKEMGMDNVQIQDSARMWVFLKCSMGLNNKSAAGIMGNVYAESACAHDNAEDNVYAGMHNSTYRYSVKDNIGYGLIQWTATGRKQGLLNMSSSMGLPPSDINAQLAYFKSEMSGDYKASWNKISRAKDVNESCDIFLKEIEMPADLNYSERRNYANVFYSILNK